MGKRIFRCNFLRNFIVFRSTPIKLSKILSFHSTNRIKKAFKKLARGVALRHHLSQLKLRMQVYNSISFHTAQFVVIFSLITLQHRGNNFPIRWIYGNVFPVFKCLIYFAALVKAKSSHIITSQMLQILLTHCFLPFILSEWILLPFGGLFGKNVMFNYVMEICQKEKSVAIIICCFKESRYS